LDPKIVAEQLDVMFCWQEFRSTWLKSKIASAADLILMMTKEHRDIVLEAAPRQLSQTFTMTEAAGEFGRRRNRLACR